MPNYVCLIIYIIICRLHVFCCHGLANVSNAAAPEIKSINGSLNFRIYKKGWFDHRLDMQHTQCVRKGHCQKLNYTTCFGAKMPYEYTSLDLTHFYRQEKMKERLENYRVLQHVPKCWAVIQPFLCSVFMPKCEHINGEDMVYLPSLEMCRIAFDSCRIFHNTSYFTEFMRCNETVFPSKCNNDVREMKFNVTGTCLKPLVPAESSASYYPGIEGCGLQCNDPLYTEDEHRQIHKLIAWGCTLCLLSNLFVVATFLIDWENANKYPALIVFYINLCFMIMCIGWLAQFTSGSREDIVCRKDGTLRHSEPTAGENLSCTVVFVLVYYFLVAAMVWFVFLTYAWHMRAVGNVQDRIDKKGSYFHLVAWSLPLVLTITTMALSEVDGNSTVGICFVGYLNHSIRSGLLLGPLCGVILVGGFFTVRGIIKLFSLKHFANDIKSTSASNKIHLLIVRMGLCALFTLIFILVSFACHANEFRHAHEWAESLREFIICRISAAHEQYSECKKEHRPSVAILQLHLLCLFGAGINMSIWCWTPSSVETWKRYIKKKCGQELLEEVKMPKHKVIAQTWAKRKEFEDKGRLSITLFNTHTDPVGLNFDVNDLNSSETNEISSTWANYLPQFVKRRMALTGAANTNNSSSQGPRKNSLDSEISFSVRHVSVESRRNSVDSQVSVKIAEMKTKVAARSRSGHGKHHHGNGSAAHTSNHKRAHRRRDFIAAAAAASARKHSAGGRRESSTSIESQVIALKKTTYPNASHKLDLFAQSTKQHHHHHHSKRRSASNAPVNPADINAFLAKNQQFLMPFLQQQNLSSSSDNDDGEETSRASFKLQDSRLDVVLKQDLSDAETESHAKKQAALECLLKHMQKSNESNAGNRNSRNSTRSRQSRKSQATTCTALTAQQQNRRSQQRKHDKAAHACNSSKKEDLDLNLQFARELNSHSSYSSTELDIPLGVMLHSSYSGMSTGKPNSRNSKTSCDVGIQANAYEIASQTEQHLNAKNLQKSNVADNNDDNDNDDDGNATEMQTLLQKQSKTTIMMSESEKLKMLLLP